MKVKTQSQSSAGAVAAPSPAVAVPDCLIRRKPLETETGLPTSTLYYLMKNDLFPRPIRIGKRAVAWRRSDVDAWKASREIAA